ncbi:3-oxoacyl-ACP synthase [Burkholderia sp. HI2761]|uniref:3-oxoacyl-ACP synthase n=1 Tax=unclassified Burkholderia TaxID=2613784 RepID=UPI000B9249FA|nr:MULTISPECIES: 3-oxoacyl-ACP synthase [unclassified Burkholderia]MPV57739.1 3-oxoacyl-ACP synthase [Burkholderia sp. BE24]OXJ23257.1 3-oxoacyl-ACP synthase [Burkholderia sp. HI2761]
MMSPIITALSTYVPPTMALTRAPRSTEAELTAPHTGWEAWIASCRADFGAAHTLTAGADDSVDHHTRPLHIPVEREEQLSGLAVRVANEILAIRHPAAVPIDIIVFCHSSVDEHVSTTTAGRLASVVGPPCFAFSISQQHGVSLFSALQLVRDLMVAESDVQCALIVAAEKWTPPFSRWTAQGSAQGDAAAAALLERATATTRGFRVMDAQTRQCPVRPDCPSNQRSYSDSASERILLQLIDAMLAQHALAACNVTGIGQDLDPTRTKRVSHRLNMKAHTHARLHDAHLGAAEPIIQLTERLEANTLPTRGPVLIWGTSVCGYVGCALLDACDAPAISREPGRSNR